MNKRNFKTLILVILALTVACFSAEASISTGSEVLGKLDPRITSAMPERPMLPPAGLGAQDPLPALIKHLNQRDHRGLVGTRGEPVLEAARRSRHHRHLQRIQTRKKSGKKNTPQLPAGTLPPDLQPPSGTLVIQT